MRRLGFIAPNRFGRPTASARFCGMCVNDFVVESNYSSMSDRERSGYKISVDITQPSPLRSVRSSLEIELVHVIVS